MADVNTLVFGVSFALYTLFIIGVGLWSARFAKRSDEDYFLAGRSLGPWVASLSASASSESGWVTMGLVGWAFASGVQAYWIIPGCLIGYLFNWFVLAGRMRDRAGALSALTLPDLFAKSFRETLPLLRVLSVIVIMVAMLLYVAAQFAAAGKAFSAAFPGVHYWHGVLIGGGVVLLYTVTGGFRAACWTDFLQALLMILALVGFPIYMLITLGGFGFISAGLEAASDPAAGVELLRLTPGGGAAAMLGFLLGAGALGINFGYAGQPHVLVRFMALRDRREARIGGAIAVSWQVMVMWGAVTVGLMARVLSEGGAEWGEALLLNTEGAQEAALIVAAINMLPGVIAGVVLAAVLAAICSTADSQLVVAASAMASDLYARIFRRSNRRDHMAVNRLVVFCLGAGAVILVIDQDIDIYKYVLTYGWAALGAGFGPQVLLLLLWRRASYAGCLAGMLTGFVVAMAWPHIYTPETAERWTGGVEIYNLPLGFMAGLAANVAFSLLAPGRRAVMEAP